MSISINGFSKLDSIIIRRPLNVLETPTTPPPKTYTFNNTTNYTLTDPSPAANRRLGYAVGVSDDGSTVAAGTVGSGVRIYHYVDTAYTYNASVTNNGITEFGRQSTLSGDGLTLFVGSAQNAIYVYKRSSVSDSAWAQTDTITGLSNLGTYPISTNRDGTRFISQDGTAVRAYENLGYWYRAESRTNTNATNGTCRMSSDGKYYVATANSGVRVFDFGGNEITYLTTHIGVTGASISGDGLTVSVTVNGAGQGSGSFLYSRPNTTSAFTISSDSPLSTFATFNGQSDSLNHDGTFFVCSSDSEIARVYPEIGTPRTFNVFNESFGFSSLLSRDGSTLVVGAHTGFGGASQAGKAYVYRANTLTV